MSPISIDEIRNIALQAFEVTCFMLPLEEWELDREERNKHASYPVKAIVRFEGAAEGGMVVRPSRELFTATAANMLGIDDPDDEEKAGALCELANIICGNTVPLFAHNEEICTICPPFIAGKADQPDTLFKSFSKESFWVDLDEGAAEISLYYSRKDLRGEQT